MSDTPKRGFPVLLLAAVAGAGLLTCVCGGVLFLVLGGWTRIANLGHPERALVLDYLKKNANDPNFEIVEWEEVEVQPGAEYESRTIVPLSYRENTGLGKQLHKRTFVVEGGKVVGSWSGGAR